MQNKYNQFFNFFLFSGLACFSYLSLVLYTDLTPQHQKILISSLGFISVVFIFNLVGFSLIVINRWLKKSSLFFIKKRNKLIINCILIAAILFFMNYATLTIFRISQDIGFIGCVAIIYGYMKSQTLIRHRMNIHSQFG